MVLVRQTERCALLEVSPQGQLIFYAESEACSRADFLHVDFLEPDALKAGAFKRPETPAQKISAGYQHEACRRVPHPRPVGLCTVGYEREGQGGWVSTKIGTWNS